MGLKSQVSSFATLLGEPADNPTLESRLSDIEYNIGTNSLRDAVNAGYSYFNMVGGVGDVFTDETGIDAGASVNATYDATGDYYYPSPSASATLLIQSETTDGSTTFTDTAGSKSITVGGDAQHDTAQAKFGSSSMLFDGTGDRLTLADSEDWNLGSGDFTIDAWVRPSSLTGTHIVISQDENSSRNRSFNLAVSSGGLIFQKWDNSGVFSSTTAGSITANVWQHIAVTRSGNTGRLYVDGTSVSTIDFTGFTFENAVASLRIADYGGPSGTYAGHIEEVRLLKGTAVWTGASFTVPTSAYSLSPTTMTLPSIDFTTGLGSVSAMRPVVLWEDITTGSTLNTDFIFEVSRDSGTTWTATTLTEDAVFSGSAVMILTGSEVNVSAQPAGTTATYRVRTANSKNIRVHGVYLQWR